MSGPWIVWDADYAHLSELVEAATAELPEDQRDTLAAVYVITGPRGHMLDNLCAALDVDKVVRLRRRNNIAAVVFGEILTGELA